MLNIFDVGIILLLIMFLIVGFKNGVIREAFALIGIIAVFILSFVFKGLLGNLMCIILPFFKLSGVIEGFSVINILIYQIIAFMLVFAILLTIYEIFLKISKFIQKLVNLTIILILPSKLLGAVVSLIKGVIVLFAVFIVLMIPLKNSELFTGSTMVNQILYKTPILSQSSNNYINTVEEIYNLAEKVSNKEISTNAANLELLDMMLKHKIVNKSTVESLVKLHKLDDVNNIETVLQKY
ncbi:MAG: CvpA family protein [Bacilli bacterium]|nr:CvpA family protein [Bacilli bacterium]